MLASCSICDDCFTGIHPESACTTPCGHVFHYECLMTWIKRSKTCPQCRSKVTEKKIIKLYFQNNSDLSVKEDISSLTHQVQSLTYENTLKKEEIKNLLTITKKDKEKLASLKQEFKDLSVVTQGHQNAVSILEENLCHLQTECKQFSCYKLEAEELRKNLVKYQLINSILYGTDADTQSAVSLLKKKSDIKTLGLIIINYKREIQTLKESNRDLETKFSHRVTKYMELKRHLCNVNSKEFVNTRVMEKLKSEITDLEAEIVRLQKKCEHLESLVQANDDTPRRTKKRKRIIYESPAPDLSITPSLEKDLKTVRNSPENSVSSMEQPKAQLKPHSLNNKTEQSSSNCIDGRSKSHVYPSRQKPVTRKRKYIKN